LKDFIPQTQLAQTLIICIQGKTKFTIIHILYGGIMKAQKLIPMAVIISALLISFALALPNEGTGSVSGIVLPTEAMATVEAHYYGDVMAMVDTDPETGEFTIEGLPAGTYDILIRPGVEGYEPHTLNSVTVNEGENTDIGEINL
jgi:hypothetical protein